MSNAFKGCLTRFVFVEKMFFSKSEQSHLIGEFCICQGVKLWPMDGQDMGSWYFLGFRVVVVTILYYTRCFIILYQSVCMFQGTILAWMILWQSSKSIFKGLRIKFPFTFVLVAWYGSWCSLANAQICAFNQPILSTFSNLDQVCIQAAEYLSEGLEVWIPSAALQYQSKVKKIVH